MRGVLNNFLFVIETLLWELLGGFCVSVRNRKKILKNNKILRFSILC